MDELWNIWGACASAGIEEGKSTQEMFAIWLDTRTPDERKCLLRLISGN